MATVFPPSLRVNRDPSVIDKGQFSSNFTVKLSPGMAILWFSGSKISQALSAVLKNNCGLYPVPKGVFLPSSSAFRMQMLAQYFVLQVRVFGLAMIIPLLSCSLVSPLISNPTLSPASPQSRVLLKVSTPVILTFGETALYPTISTSSPILILPCSTVPVATAPLPLMLYVDSTDIKNGLSRSLTGISISLSMMLSNYSIFFSPISGSVSFKALRADPLIILMLSPLQPWWVSTSLVSISTSSIISGSLTRSILFSHTIIVGTPICLQRRTCSLLMGITPSAAETTRIPASILAAPVIIFLTQSMCPGQSTCPQCFFSVSYSRVAVLMVIPLAFSSGALSIIPYSMYLAIAFLERYLVMAAVRVVLP